MGGEGGSVGERWVPLCVSLGMPLYCLNLCRMVCCCAVEDSFLSPKGRTAQAAAQAVMHVRLSALIAQYSTLGAQYNVLETGSTGGRGAAAGTSAQPAQVAGGPRGTAPGRPQLPSSQANATPGGAQQGVFGPVVLPIVNLFFDGTNLQPIDLSDCLQGLGLGFQL